jgi:hypothetical protein
MARIIATIIPGERRDTPARLKGTHRVVPMVRKPDARGSRKDLDGRRAARPGVKMVRSYLHVRG